ncbi:hypothetical protein [Streptomyces thermovulgaris]|uniref:hypothetical protein n=1 Tax=Streptomyces thermovulgaris TaxID=1934 RepID=UPI0011814154|nr:hypothetical protein [Streptomyces thermovulgaris]
MSTGVASPMVDTVAPTVAFAPPPPVEPSALPHTGAVHLGDTAHEASAHLADLAGEAAHQAADAALTALGALSGALLAGRAALATTRLLASAAVRAAEEQRCLERQEEISALAAEQWQNAAYAAARANARRTALLARVSRAARTAPDDPPPCPDLPGPLNPVDTRLGSFRSRLARFEKALEQAEAAQAAWEVAALTASLDRMDEGDDWQDAMRARRDTMLQAHMKRHTAVGEQQEATDSVPPALPVGGEADRAAVRERGADILAALDPQADPAIVRLATEAVGHATRHAAANPRRARIHLREARKFVESANRKARKRRHDEERAALQLNFLTMELPDDQDLPDRNPEVVDALRRFLEEGVPLASRQQELVERAVAERHNALEALYLRTQCAGVMARLAEGTEGALRIGRTEDGEVGVDWTPDGWGPDHWLRATLTGGTCRVVTMRADTPGERLLEEWELDDLRCAEAQQKLAEFQKLARDAGLDMRFELERTQGAEPGEPLERTDEEPRRGTRADDRPGLRRKTVKVGDDERR